MKFSIITASFNSQNGISNCLSSILNQNYSNFEIISIDGKSNDNTSYIINNMLRNSDKKVFEIDHGIYDALNKGIKISTGDIIGVLHSDDVYASNNILQLVADKFIETNLAIEHVRIILYEIIKDLSNIVYDNKRRLDNLKIPE